MRGRAAEPGHGDPGRRPPGAARPAPDRRRGRHRPAWRDRLGAVAALADQPSPAGPGMTATVTPPTIRPGGRVAGVTSDEARPQRRGLLRSRTFLGLLMVATVAAYLAFRTD